MRTALTLFFTMVFLFARPAFAEFVVLSSTEKSIAVGAVIGDAQEISLPKNKTLMLIDQAGRTITLNGPHKGKIEGKSGGTTDSTQVKVLSSLIRDNEDGAASVGRSARSIKSHRGYDRLEGGGHGGQYFGNGRLLPIGRHRPEACSIPQRERQERRSNRDRQLRVVAHYVAGK